MACGRLRLAPGDRARAHAAVARGVGASGQLHLSRLNGLLPLLHLPVARGDVQIPEAARLAVDANADVVRVRNLTLAAELIRLLRLCSAHGFPVVPLKGIVLAQQIYGAVELRRVSDLDLLVREPELERVVHLLEANGYQPCDLPSQADEIVRSHSHHVAVRHAEKTIRVELHRYLLRPRARGRWDFDEIAPRLTSMEFQGRTVSAFTPEDLLVYLCEHGAEHTWIRLEWLVAIAELVRSGQVQDWERVLRWARDLGTTGRLRAALLLANELLGLDLSAVPVSSDRAAHAANRIVVRRLAGDPFRVLETPGERFGYLFRTDSTSAARLRRCWTTAMTPSAADIEAFPLPRVLFPLYVAVRPIRLAARRVRRGI